jgi:hypothetical protein
MAEYSFLNLEQIAESQSGKEITANAILEALAKGTGITSVSVASGNVTLTETQSHYGVILLTGAPGAARVVTVDSDISRWILFRNDTTGGQTIEVKQAGGTNFPVPAGHMVLLLSTTAAIGIRSDTFPILAPLNDTGVFLQSQNSAAGLAEQFKLLHDATAVRYRNARAGGHIFDGAAGIDTSVTYEAPAGQAANLILNALSTGGSSVLRWRDNGTDRFQLYKLQSGPELYLRDMVNSRMHVTFTPGTAGNAVTAFEDKISIGGGTAIAKHLSATTTWDPADTADGAVTSTTVTVTGGAVGDTVAVGFSQAVPAGALLVGAVTAADQATVTLFNHTGSNLNLASGTLRVDVWKH